jgi:hypothetical protein
MKLAIGIINNNDRFTVDKILDRVTIGLPKSNWWAWIVDNGCVGKEKTQEMVRWSSLPLNYLETEEVVTRAVLGNLLIKKAKFADMDWLWLVDHPDIVTKTNWRQIKSLIDDKAGLIGIDNSEARWGSKRWQWFLDRRNISTHSDNISWIQSKNIILNLNVPNKVLNFKENYFLGFEGVDLCWRLKQNGFLIKFMPKKNLYHNRDRFKSFLGYYFFFRNPLLFCQNKGLKDKVMFTLISAVFLGWWGWKLVVKKHRPDWWLGCTSGWIDGMKLAWAKSPSKTS